MPESLEQRLIDLLLQYKAFKIEDFVLKSGRVAPYYIDFGKINDGFGLIALSEIYASKIKELERSEFNESDVIFGLSYKGLVIGEACVTSLARDGINKRFAYDRKEEKKHGESGWFVGEIKDGDRILIVDDVFTTGETKEGIIKQLRKYYKDLRFGILVGVNREECDEEKYSCYDWDNIKSITSITKVFKHLAETGKIDAAAIGKFKNYMRQYGTNEAKKACEAIWPLSLSKVIKN